MFPILLEGLAVHCYVWYYCLVVVYRVIMRLAIAPLAVASRTITWASLTRRPYVSANEVSGSAPAMWDSRVCATWRRVPGSLIAKGTTSPYFALVFVLRFPPFSNSEEGLRIVGPLLHRFVPILLE